MSRIGRMPLELPAGVTVTVSPENVVTVKGPKGTLTREVNKNISIKIENNVLTVSRPEGKDDTKELHAMHGLYRKLIGNMVEGVTNGFQKALFVNGVGYKVAKQGNKIVVNVGYSHPVEVVEPTGITFETPSNVDILVKGIDKELVGQAAADIRNIRRPDPYHAYGIAYRDEVVFRKEGKKAGK